MCVLAKLKFVLLMQESYPDASVAFRCPDSAVGAVRPSIGTEIPAHFISPASAAGINTSVWVAEIFSPPVTNSSASNNYVASSLAFYTLAVDCGGAIGYANATCAIDSSTGVPLDVIFNCPALVWTPSCG